MAMMFGVKSQEAADTKLSNGYRLYDWVMRQNGFPAFWGRDLDGSHAVTEAELAYLREKQCKVALVLRDLSEKAVSAVDGTADALRAVETAKEMGVPQNSGIVLFAEIQPDWSVNHNWMISFAEMLYKNGYIPGFIGNTDSSKNFNFDRQCSHFVQATEEEKQFGAVYWATEPREEGEPQGWMPYCPSALTREDMSLWTHGKILFGELATEEVYARDETLLAHLW